MSETPPTPTGKRPHVVVVSAAVSAARRRPQLKRRRRRRHPDRPHTYNTFQPLLYQVATAGLNPGDVTFVPARHPASAAQRPLPAGHRQSIDHDAKHLHLDESGRVEYDYLVLACGVTTNYFGIPGAEEYSLAALHPVAGARPARPDVHQPRARGHRTARTRTCASWWSAAARPASRWPARSPSCATTPCRSRIRSSTATRIHIVLVEMVPTRARPVPPEAAAVRRRSPCSKRDVDLRLSTSVKEVRRTVSRRAGRRAGVPPGRHRRLGLRRHRPPDRRRLGRPAGPWRPDRGRRAAPGERAHRRLRDRRRRDRPGAAAAAGAAGDPGRQARRKVIKADAQGADLRKPSSTSTRAPWPPSAAPRPWPRSSSCRN